MKKGLFKKLAAVLLSGTMIFTAVPASVLAADSLESAETDGASNEEVVLLEEGSGADENFNLPEEEAVKVYPETEEIVTDEYFYEESVYDSTLWTGSLQVGSSISLTFSRAIEFEDYSDDVVTVTGALSEDGTKTTFNITGNSVGSAVVPVNSSYELNLTVTGFDLSSYEIAASSDEVAAKVREGIKNRDEEISVYVFNPRNNLGAPSSVMPQVYAHTGEGNEGDYIKYGSYTHAQYSTSTVMDNSSGYNRIVISDDGASWLLKYTYTFTYYDDAAQEEELAAALDDVMTELNLDSLPDDYSRVKAIYDYICENVTYDYTNLNDEDYLLKYSAYAALINGTSVCNGYAALFYRMACMAGLDARIIAGQATSSMENHAWNIVKLDGKYYYLDATWDAGNGNYSWFLRGTSSFAEHYAFSEFSEEEFTSNYPIAEENYVYVPAEEDDTVWGDPVWTWEVDGTAAATFTSVNDETVTKTIDADVDIEETEDGYIYTASVEFNDETYTDTRTHTHAWDEGTVTTEASCEEAGEIIYTCDECGAEKSEEIEALGHSYGQPVWSWNAEYSEASAVFTCENDSSHVSEESAEITTSINGSYIVFTASVTFEGTVYTNRAARKGTAFELYSDLSEDEWYADAVSFAVDQGFMGEYLSTGTFAPYESISRGTVITVLYKMAGSPEVAYDADFSSKCTDVKETDWCYDAVRWAYSIGMTNGYYGTNTFKHYEPVIRQTLSSMLTTYLKLVKNVDISGYDLDSVFESKNLTDASEIADWSSESVAWMTASGYMAGAGGTSEFCPNDSATRSAFATIIRNMYDVLAAE